MAAPIVYRWDDGNAPVARGERRSLCDILYACLVTGYGTKPGAGWTREYVNATFDKAAFRNNPATGTGFFLQVDGAGTANAYTNNIQGFESMSSEDDGLGPFNATSMVSPLTSSAGTTARPWILIADDLAFYFFCWGALTAAPGNTDYLGNSMFFGDIIKRKPDDAYACCFTAAVSNYYGSFGFVSSSSTAGVGQPPMAPAFPRKSNGIVGSYLATVIKGGGPSSELAMGNLGLPYTPGDPLYITRPYINEGEAYTMRGSFPGLYYPCHAFPKNQLEQFSSDGLNFLSVIFRGGSVSSNYNCNFLFSLDDWRI